ncbi:shufflon system plasmid conjugative transfer pilus tip adhesin PilV [Serratia fonticola]|uniref:shufflon system plasmid conjugative transfer pilus tip adhesin PilV n=1 Tax=Serratia fonticola TaxID=47917 RepID=UPI0009D6A0EB|nr:shufflon system plasmid conjugative transfer pilus tip adhesin PilV [Serratia fonticola]
MKIIPSSPKIHRGYMALEALGVLLIIMLASVFAAEKVSEYLQEKEWGVMAIHATTFNEAAKSYIADNTDSLLATSTPGNPTKITPSLLISKGYLQNGFSAENSYGQTYVTAVVKNDKLKDKLQALTCTVSGTAIPYRGLRSISTQIQGMGGYVNEDNVATGAYGGWTSNTRDFGITCTTGHIAIALSSEVLGTAMQESDRLYRYQVNGRPDLNRMHTSIDMGANDLNNANKINAKMGNFSEDVNGKRLIANDSVWSNGWIGSNGDIRSNAGWLISKHGKGWLNEDHGGGFYMDDNDWIRSVNNKGIYTGGQLKGGTVRADGRASVGEYLQLDGTANVGWGCSPNGLVSRDASGAILYCQNGLWTASGKLKDFQMVSGGDACGKYNYSNAYCPAGKQLLSGGYILSRWGGDGWNAPDLTKPTADGNGWQIYTGGGVDGGSCIQAIAWCANN